MTISMIALAITSAFGGGGGTGGSPPKGEGVLKKWLDRLADALKRITGKAVESLSTIVGSVVGAILSFLGKVVGFVAEHTWALIVFVAGLISVWLMQRVQNKVGHGAWSGFCCRVSLMFVCDGIKTCLSCLMP